MQNIVLRRKIPLIMALTLVSTVLIGTGNLYLGEVTVCPKDRVYNLRGTPIWPGTNVINFMMQNNFAVSGTRGGYADFILTNYIGQTGQQKGLTLPLDQTGLIPWLIDNGYWGDIPNASRNPNPDWIPQDWLLNPASMARAVNYWRAAILGGTVTITYNGAWFYSYSFPAKVNYYLSFAVSDQAIPVHSQTIDTGQGKPNYKPQQLGKCGSSSPQYLFQAGDDPHINLSIGCPCSQTEPRDYYFKVYA
jgi:hypothetical protein